MQLLLAPIQGVTGYLFRNAWSDGFKGIDKAYTPFIPSVTGHSVKAAHIAELLPVNNTSLLPLVPQVLGNRSQPILLMAKQFAMMGFQEMNLNMGCPSPKVVRRGRGCGLMYRPEQAEMLLSELIPEIPLRLSVKLRLGWKDKEELWTILRILNSYPLEKIILHPRLGIWQYDGTPDCDAFEQALEHSRHPLVYNGDINTLEVFTGLRQRFPQVTEWMLGRGVLMNPFLPAMLRGEALPSEEEARERLRAFHSALMQGLAGDGLAPQRILSRLKEFWFYFSRWFVPHEQVWYGVSHCNDLMSMQHVINRAFRERLQFFM